MPDCTLTPDRLADLRETYETCPTCRAIDEYRAEPPCMECSERVEIARKASASPECTHHLILIGSAVYCVLCTEVLRCRRNKN